MNQHLKTIQDLLQQNKQLSEQEKDAVIKAIADADKQWSITDFKLDRTEKVKKTTAILLEETIAELEQKRKAVEAQNRELEIESALERVRSVAMGMKKPEDMLDVCKTISQQLEFLHIKEIRNIQTAIFHGATTIYINYEFYPKHDKLFITEVDYNNHPVAEDFADRMTKGPNHVWTHEFKGEEVRDWLTFQKTTNVFIDSYLEKANSLNYYWYSLGPVALGISTYSPLNEEEVNLFKRFRNVFELAYRRYIDIEKAQAQAREAQIELALERVRARTMAMQKSGELAETSLVLFQQFKDLGETSEQISIGIFNENVMELYSTIYGSQWKEAAKVDLNEPVVMKKIHKAWRDHKKSLVIDLAGKDLQKYNAFRKKLSNLEYKEDRWVIHIAFFSKGVLTFSTTEPHPQETIQLLERFAGVFDQTYTRFLDLQKAEAQAREAQIQLALERVRARTMAMQHSDELKDAAALLFQQVKSLGVPAYSCGYNIWEKNEKEFTSWMSSQDGSDFNAVSNIPLTEDANFIRFADSRQKGEPFFVLELRGDRMQEHYEYLKTIPAFKAYFDYAVSMGFDLPETQIHHVANFSQGNLLFITLDPCPEFHDVFKRFAAVFEQTYTRFLDLQKAEAQARESQIEAALERVRSRSMAMHHSGELATVASVLFQQLYQLGIVNLRRFFIQICDESNSILKCWYTSEQGEASANSYSLPFDENPVIRKGFEAWKKREPISITLSGAGMRDFVNHLIEHGYVYPKGEAPVESFVTNQYPFSYGQLNAITYEPLIKSEFELIGRFAKVFEQTYTRFLDLQKSEAQAREAQIELALERVRASSMAMQDSGDIHQVINVVTEQLQSLGIHFDTANFITNYTDNGWDMWVSAPGVPVPDRIYVPYLDIKVFNQVINAKMQNNDFFSYTLSREEKNEFFKYLFENTLMRYTPEERKQYVYQTNGLAASVVILNNVFFTVAKYQSTPYAEQENAVIKRIGNVFDQSYTRFLDLQKAEAQAKEAQIEAALERVRARTMAMHSSEDVSSATATMFNELEKLNIQNFRGGILNIRPDQTMEVWSVNTLDDGRIIRAIGDFDMTMHPFWRQLYQGWINNDESFQFDMSGKVKEDYVRILDARRDYLPNGLQYLPDCIVQSYFFGEGAVWTFSSQPHSEEDKQVMKRFASVFSLTFRRYKDLQKAEAQAREAQIEAALEKVRSRTMAMQRSEELSNVATVLFQQVKSLGVPQWACGFCIWDIGDTESMWYPGGRDGEILAPMRFPLTEHPVFRIMDESRKRGDELYIYEKEGEVQADHYRYMMTLPGVREVLQGMLDAGLTVPTFQIDHYANFAYGNLIFITYEHFPEMHDIFKRFAKVFEQTYTRFLDLQKAEAQAREAKIEAALERVRAKAMAMHKSDDLKMAVATVFEELDKLNLGLIRCGIAILDKEKPRGDIWVTVKSEQGNTIQLSGDEPLDYHPLLQGAYDSWLKQEDFSYALKGEELASYYRAVTKVNFQLPISATFDAEIKDQNQFYYNAVFQDGSIFAFLDTAFTDEAKTVMKRFANVFNLTYKRFLDLQKAEAQAREARIEASLERVRAHAMAMHNSTDLSSAVNIFFKELKALGIIPMRCGVGEMQEETRTSNLVFTTADKQGELYELPGNLKHEGHPVVENIYNYWKLQEEYHPVLQGTDINAYYRIIKSQMTLPDFPEYAKHYGNYFYFREGFFFAWADKELSEEGLNICRRFTSVLSLTYKRYKDLKTAEANAREATIEAALEKVRGKAMAMHNSEDLSSTAGMVFTELRKLGISAIRTGVGLLTKGERKALAYGTTTSGHTDNLSLTGSVILDGHPTLSNQYDSWLRKEDYFPVLKGELLKTYYEKLSSSYSYPLPDEHTGYEQYGYFLMFTEGYMFCWSKHRYTDAEIKILKRFTSVIDLTFRRYMELQKSEANAREAIKQAALDRVRAEIASMRTISDLDRITPLIWNELNILGIPFIRCGVFIMDESQQLIHTFLSTPDGKAIAAFHLPYDTPGHFPDLIDHWRHKKIYVSRWSQDDFVGIANTLVRQGAIVTKEQYLSTLPKGGFYLHFLPFLQGLLYVGNTDQLGQEEIILIQHVADAFSTAYARYEDFNKLEAAKQQVDKTLVDLKQAQTQLVQSEKMASLGELTAGIAHEIQNPLNFVNNFSDVSNELLEEMKGELATGNMQQAIAIADDVRQNLEKILHHGKRADAIVKGMLQHSRASSGQKEPTDINALADEYLRLAYHGLRAKEKSFNAKFETNFDNSISKINIIPQEIGRVVLNLINNAFYAVSEKKKTEGEAYEPTVTVSTRNHPASADKESGYVEIKVSDNGIGISEMTRDKIFQPFFTTKPSGQGTGLGLSLAYDIITKGHGGDIMVKSIPGKGSEFIVHLPENATL